MTLLTMSVTASGFIMAVLLVRAVGRRLLPKRLFCTLWGLVLVTLLLPGALPMPAALRFQPAPRYAPHETMLTFLPVTVMLTTYPPNAPAAAVPSLNRWLMVWGAGAVSMALVFLFGYWRQCRRFRGAWAVTHEFVLLWQHRQGLRRPLRIRVSDHIRTPLTYGLLFPVILLPACTDWQDETALTHILTHELLHIRRFDLLFKWGLALALCVHWFNPFAWAMFFTANRDIELACDEGVLTTLGLHEKAAYALSLIAWEERRSGLLPLRAQYTEKAIEERIGAIMTTKKKTFLTLCAAVIVATLFGLGTIWMNADFVAPAGSYTFTPAQPPREATPITVTSSTSQPPAFTAPQYVLDILYEAGYTLDDAQHGRIQDEDLQAIVREINRQRIIMYILANEMHTIAQTVAQANASIQYKTLFDAVYRAHAAGYLTGTAFTYHPLGISFHNCPTCRRPTTVYAVAGNWEHTHYAYERAIFARVKGPCGWVDSVYAGTQRR